MQVMTPLNAKKLKTHFSLFFSPFLFVHVLSCQVTKVSQVDGDSPVRFSTETSFVVDKYEIL